ncbi:uncharacterized protein LOC120349519 [Nilaparvata lugens]|uniref:uncharacterized protein LOC120349519 n=1 Tax=Nilaparvata lugens TaxID=108931 RepID=UPI00193D7437|nr:uncharacterized protein LOC120349519 [Nilaparvata lugens]
MKHMAYVRCRADCTIRYAVRASVQHVWKYLYIHLSWKPYHQGKEKTFLAKCKEIRQISEDIGGERITVKEFLEAAAATIGRKVGMPNDEEDGEEEDEEDDLGPPLIPEPRQPPVEARYAGPSLERYRLERVVLQFDDIQDCPPPEFVAEQLRELEANLAEREATAPHTNLDPQCTYCQTNRATRIVVPCGHWAGQIMPRVQKRAVGARKYKDFSSQQLEKAVEAVKSGLSLRKAQEKFGVPRCSINRAITGKHSGKVGRPFVLSETDQNI